ncbi:ABC transporter permease [Actibacterium pelagium]|uniref:Transport permease protein n=1 Tax=Actibacterium pelagium TaxID=2029103 RepID=A0A917AHD7_9RHOB|nr:ABC transporter permease [Actibacterium pelagium]GGE51718.1 transport permease protein [Actibacterium pelagium]
MQNSTGVAERRFGKINWLGLYTLSWREIRRFLGVWSQTLAAPLVTAGLFLAVFSLAFGSNRAPVMGVPFLHFLAPGILMMTVIQNAFANTSSSIMIAKVQGNIVDTLMPPLSPFELMLGYLAGAVARGLFVAVAISGVLIVVLGLPLAHPIWALVFTLLGSVFLGGLGILAGIVAQKFDQMAAITNFVVTPLSFLSGTFYSIERLPEAMQIATHFNPIFYLIDGVRFGMIGASDSSPWLGLTVCLLSCGVVCGLSWYWLRTGYRLKP